jgi:hypothetical protein
MRNRVMMRSVEEHLASARTRGKRTSREGVFQLSPHRSTRALAFESGGA